MAGKWCAAVKIRFAMWNCDEKNLARLSHFLKIRFTSQKAIAKFLKEGA
jgi:hypothetical protein